MINDMADNFDTEEINKFDQGSEKWWDKNGDFKTLHDINPLRLEFILQKSELSNKRVIDVGCGGGILSESLAAHASHVSGIDLSTSAITAANEHKTQPNLDYYQMSIKQHAASSEPCDVLVCMELLEHVPDPAELIHDCSSLLKTGGHVFFSTINRNLTAYVQLVLAGEYLLKMLPRGTHDYRKFIKPSELSCWCRQAQLEVQDISGMAYSPLNNSYYLTKSPISNYLLHAIKL